ncbi:discoidin domain-containing protein, partial [Gemmatimonadota bacterium]
PPPSPSYPGSGPGTLTDGLLGTRDHRDGLWLGWSGEDMEAVIDLGRPRAVRRVGVDCLQSQGAWIFFPSSVDFAVSGDGEEWTSLGRVDVPLVQDSDKRVRRFQVGVAAGAGDEPVRFVRIRAGKLGPLPDWHAAAGEPAWLFVDEVVVEGA